MAGGWTRDGAVHEQIEASIDNELNRLRSRRAPIGESWTHCAECEEPIPDARRLAVPGVKLCLDCQEARDARPVHRGGIKRRQPTEVGEAAEQDGRTVGERLHERRERCSASVRTR